MAEGSRTGHFPWRTNLGLISRVQGGRWGFDRPLILWPHHLDPPPAQMPLLRRCRLRGVMACLCACLGSRHHIIRAQRLLTACRTLRATERMRIWGRGRGRRGAALPAAQRVTVLAASPATGLRPRQGGLAAARMRLQRRLCTEGPRPPHMWRLRALHARVLMHRVGLCLRVPCACHRQPNIPQELGAVVRGSRFTPKVGCGIELLLPEIAWGLGKGIKLFPPGVVRIMTAGLVRPSGVAAVWQLPRHAPVLTSMRPFGRRSISVKVLQPSTRVPIVQVAWALI